ncbi:MAG: division/cell wall cluster transcriptional repressor MraZ [Burkholderiales bacterium]|nr:division/cell wall cluster transcriptional repressor MraZ [Burkholderiales bacterium]MDQ3197446.1 division/cell wall cluster transcriptional repressor MraZ [Pseudomonadota bacterium]
MFHGLAHLNLDSKARLAIPAEYRDALIVQCEGRLVLTADPSRCVLVYPEPEWKPVHQKIMALSGLHPVVRSLQRLVGGYAKSVVMDAAGRILVPPGLREFAKLDKRVIMVGQGNKFELWDAESWASQCELALALNTGQMPAELEGFSL